MIERRPRGVEIALPLQQVRDGGATKAHGHGLVDIAHISVTAESGCLSTSMPPRQRQDHVKSGTLSDCDFDLGAGTATVHGALASVFDFGPGYPQGRELRFAGHCFGRTARARSSCCGSMTQQKR
ncbi:MAG: hypothetical protein Kow0067_12500 [Coriobacteriia bacterium]